MYNLTNVNALNGWRYVDAGNGTDIQVTLDECDDAACTVVLPPGDYEISDVIELDQYQRLIGSGILETRIYPAYGYTDDYMIEVVGQYTQVKDMSWDCNFGCTNVFLI